MTDINVHDFKSRSQEPESFHLIDVREVHEHEEFNLGGRNLPVAKIQHWVAELEALKGETVIVYCRSGNRSGMAAAFMRAKGFTDVLNLTGGTIAWKQAYES